MLRLPETPDAVGRKGKAPLPRFQPRPIGGKVDETGGVFGPPAVQRGADAPLHGGIVEHDGAGGQGVLLLQDAKGKAHVFAAVGGGALHQQVLFGDAEGALQVLLHALPFRGAVAGGQGALEPLQKGGGGVAHPADGHHLPGKPGLPQLTRQTAALRQAAAEQQHHVRPGRAEGVLQRGGVQLGHIPPGQKLRQGVEVAGVLCKAGHWFSSSR